MGQKQVEDILSLKMLGMTDLPFFRYDALKPSTDSMMSGGRTKLGETRKKQASHSGDTIPACKSAFRNKK